MKPPLKPGAHWSLDHPGGKDIPNPDRVWFTYGLTVNLGNYNSVKFDAGMASDVRPGETPQQAIDRCRKVADAEIERENQRLKKRPQPREDEF